MNRCSYWNAAHIHGRGSTLGAQISCTFVISYLWAGLSLLHSAAPPLPSHWGTRRCSVRVSWTRQRSAVWKQARPPDYRLATSEVSGRRKVNPSLRADHREPTPDDGEISLAVNNYIVSSCSRNSSEKE